LLLLLLLSCAVIDAARAAVDARVAKLHKKLDGLRAAGPPPDARAREEHETEVKETELKLAQAELSRTRVDAVARAATGGVEGSLTELEAEATK
jgi:hypothetical protein